MKKVLLVLIPMILLFSLAFPSFALINVEDMSRFSLPTVVSPFLTQAPELDGVIGDTEYGFEKTIFPELTYASGISFSDINFSKDTSESCLLNYPGISLIKERVCSAFDEEYVYFGLEIEKEKGLIIKNRTKLFINFGLDGKTGAYLSGSGIELNAVFSGQKISGINGVAVTKTLEDGKKKKYDFDSVLPANEKKPFITEKGEIISGEKIKNEWFGFSEDDDKYVLEFKILIELVKDVSISDEFVGTLFVAMSLDSAGKDFVLTGAPSQTVVQGDKTWAELVKEDTPSAVNSKNEVMRIPVIMASSLEKAYSLLPVEDKSKNPETRKEPSSETVTNDETPETKEAFVKEDENDEELFFVPFETFSSENNASRISESDTVFWRIVTVVLIFVTLAVAISVSAILNREKIKPESEENPIDRKYKMRYKRFNKKKKK